MKASVRFLQHFRLHSRTVSVPDSHIGHIPYVWLRDACQCPRCVHPSTRQKLFQTSDVPIDVKPAEDQRGLLLQKDELGLRWMDRYVSTWSMDFLEKYRNAAAREDLHHDSNTQPIRWDKRMARSSRDLFLPYSALSKDSGRLAAFRQLKQYGLLFVCGVPNEHASDEHCELRTLASLFGQIRHTFYGQVWDVKAIKDSKNIAYTDLNLGMHMDLLYVNITFFRTIAD
jgi:gamma-butyrobetaine dioxygenase